MSDTYYELQLTNREIATCSARIYHSIKGLILDKRNERVMLDGPIQIISASDVVRVREVKPQVYAPHPHEKYPPLTDEQRQANLDRLGVLRQVFKDQKQGEGIANPYPDRDIRAKMMAEERRAFRGEFFDVCFEDDEAEKRAMAHWLAFHRGHRDPRSYSREGCIMPSKRVQSQNV
jgi:hypothetical protein